jgi:hypothetical protein
MIKASIWHTSSRKSRTAPSRRNMENVLTKGFHSSASPIWESSKQGHTKAQQHDGKILLKSPAKK